MAADLALSSTLPPARTRRRARVPILVTISGLILLAVVVLAVFGPWLAPLDPAAQDLLATLRGPGGGHPLGTDDLGRDVLSRVIAGTRAAIIGPLLVMAGNAILGGALGMLAGLAGGWTDAVISRALDVMYTLPGLVVVIVLVGVTGSGYWMTAAVFIVLGWPNQTRMCRSASLGQSRLTYLDAARTLGLSRFRIMRRHLLPNIAPIVLTTMLLEFTAYLIGFSSLQYLGVGAPPGGPDWGSMIAQGQAYITANPWMSMAPVLAIIMTAVSATILGDWAYDRLAMRTGRS